MLLPKHNQAIESYDNRRIEEARKRDEQPGTKFKDSAISGMPDPDDDEGGEDSQQSRKCEKAESAIWRNFDNYKMIKGKQTKTNSLPGKERRYYQWDDWHKEIEVYDRHGQPLEVIDPIKGKVIPKSVSMHSRIDL